MPGHVPSFARCFFHFQRNSGFMKILYFLLKCVCVCLRTCALHTWQREPVWNSWIWLGVFCSLSSLLYQLLRNNYQILSTSASEGSRGCQEKWIPLGSRPSCKEVFLFPPSPFFPCLPKFFENHWLTEMNLLPFSKAVLQKHCFSLPSFWKKLRGWEFGIIFPAKYLEYLQCSYFRLPGKRRASVR